MATTGGSPGKFWNGTIFIIRCFGLDCRSFALGRERNGNWPNEENDMKRIAAYLASAALAAALVGSGPAWAQMGSDIAGHRYPYNPDNYAYNYGYPYNYAYGFGYPYNYAYGYPSSYASGYGYPYADSYGYANPFAIVTAPIAALAAPATALTTPVAAAAPFCSGDVRCGSFGDWPQRRDWPDGKNVLDAG